MTADRLHLGDDALGQIFRRMAFNVMARNCDDHTKNFAFLLANGRPWQLAPAYDVTHAFNPKGKWTYQHLMSVKQKFSGMTRDDLLEVADRFGVRKPEAALADIRTVVAQWPDFANSAGVPVDTQRRVQHDLLPL